MAGEKDVMARLGLEEVKWWCAVSWRSGPCCLERCMCGAGCSLVGWWGGRWPVGGGGGGGVALGGILGLTFAAVGQLHVVGSLGVVAVALLLGIVVVAGVVIHHGVVVVVPGRRLEGKERGSERGRDSAL
ncbi:hypothetical protein E2C01_026583 [Portunus trituberculatus]|uniref:Uncharacterized protein n=1 Tax=Portunus trituberculatus TaxID=210409 RepID=A0A5B7EFS4_PORTR|nr:hypothetical protein [Portunus trituberculatus]